MEMNGQRELPAKADTVWKALNDPALLQRSIAGCESFEANGDNAYASVVAVKLGPVSARFKADITLSNVDAPNSYTINFDGKGGVAGFGKGSADIKLTPQGETTLLTYAARAQVGGKLAQIGSRLIDAASAKLTEDFFTAFEKEVTALEPARQAGTAVQESTTTTATEAAAQAAAPTNAKKILYGVAVGLIIWLLWTVLKK